MGLFRSTDYANATDEQLMQLVCKKDCYAFELLYERYSKLLLRYFFSMLNYDEDKAQDFLQDLFVKLLEKPDYFNPQMNFRTWIFCLAANMCKNEFRKISGRYYVSEDHVPEFGNPYQQETYDSLDEALLKQSLEESIKQLGYKHKSVFVMRFQEEMSIREISNIMNISEGTVKSRLYYALKKMEKLMPEFNPKD
jgi:RNA polymerase sigma-70 factor (ECF subfamily)